MSNNEMEAYEKRISEGGGVSLQPDPSLDDPSAGEGSETDYEEQVAAGTHPGIDKKKKKLVTMGIGGGLLLVLVALVATKFSGGSAPKEEYLAPQSSTAKFSPGQPSGSNDQGTLLAPTQGAATPLVFGDSVPGAAGNPDVSTNPVAGSQATAPAPFAPQPPKEPQPTGIQAPVAPPVMAATSAAGFPARNAPSPGLTPPGAGPEITTTTQTTHGAPGAGGSSMPNGPGKPLESNAKETELRAQVNDLKREVAELRLKLAEKSSAVNASSSPAAKPRPAPVVAAKPVTRTAPAMAPAKVATQKSEVVDSGSPVSVKAEDLRGVVTKPGTKPTNGKVRADFTVYAVTDGRVWVVGKDGERLGPLAIGSPLTDGSKITGIDVTRGEVNTSSGVIQ